MRARFTRILVVTHVFLAGLLAMSCLFSSPLFSSTISNVPSDTRIHSYIEELGRRGLLRNFSFSDRPYSREKVVEGLALLDKAVGSGQVKLSPYEAWLVERLKDEFATQVTKSQTAGQAGTSAQPAGNSTVELGAELQGVATSSEREVTWIEEVGGEESEETKTESEGTGRAILSGWTEVTLPHGLSLSHRFRVDTNVSEDPGFLGRPWRDELGGYVANGYGKLALGPFEFLLGRDKVSWGPGKSGSLILSDLAPPMDMICMSLHLGRVTATGFFTTLGDLKLEGSVPYEADSLYPGEVISRHLSGHRLDVRITRDLEVGLSETVVYGGPDRGLEPGYINPLCFYYAEQWNLNENDNPMWSFDATWWPKERLQLYGQFLVDDYQFERKSSTDKEPPEIAFLLGLHSGDPFGLLNTSVNLEYVRVNPWTYSQPLPWNKYVYGGALLGHPLGPDADAFYVSVTRWLNEKFTCEIDYRFARHGETSIENDWPVPVVGPWGDASFPEGSFPLGTAEKSHRVGILAGFHPTLHLDVDGFASLERVSDYRNLDGAKLTSYEIGLSVSFRPEWVIGN
ncbi:MAG: hypothetical protein NTX17_06370 [Candidatus Eisenbacteria bacterium]|nr:hypothetical protein [Candidatus Eisenbacteria bacterium]